MFQNVAAGRGSDLCDNGELMKAVVEVCMGVLNAKIGPEKSNERRRP
jgi:hypothetical protein